MALSLRSHKPHDSIMVLALLLILRVVIEATLVQCGTIEGSRRAQEQASGCRKHRVYLTEFGGVGDGKKSNTNAFKAAIANLSKAAQDGGAELYVPPGKWLTGSFSLTSHFTLYLHQDALLLASQDESEYPILPPLPSYGRGIDTPGGRYSSLIFGTNLTDVVITGGNATIDGQGNYWWDKFRKNEINLTRPYLIEIMYSDQVQIFNLTLVNSPSWNIHPVYSSNVIFNGITIRAPVDSPKTDGINPDSCKNVRIEDIYIVSGDDCISIKSGWDEYGLKFGMPTEHVTIKRVTCISPTCAILTLGSEMSGGVRDIRAEDLTALNTKAAIRIKTSPGKGAFVKDIYVKGMTLKRMRYVFYMTGNYSNHPDSGYDPRALPVVRNINFRDVTAENVLMSANLEGIERDVFTGICMSNVSVSLGKRRKDFQWNCANVEGVSSGVKPRACDLLPDKNPGRVVDCPFPSDKLLIEDVELKTCPSRPVGPEY